MTHRARSEGQQRRRQASTPDRSHPSRLPPGRECPWCGSRDTVFVQRGLAGGQESKDQYILCHDCRKSTYDIVSSNEREIRMNRYHTGGSYRDPAHQTRYTIYRMLKVGFDEFLLYLRPIVPTLNETE